MASFEGLPLKLVVQQLTNHPRFCVFRVFVGNEGEAGPISSSFLASTFVLVRISTRFWSAFLQKA
jgi:hypothetical protein